MAVIMAPRGGGFNPLSILGMISAFVPGMQALSPYLMGANAIGSAIQGDWGGAAKQVAGLALGGGFPSAGAGAAASAIPAVTDAAVNASMTNNLVNELSGTQAIPEVENLGNLAKASETVSPKGLMSSISPAHSSLGAVKMLDANPNRYDQSLNNFNFSGFDRNNPITQGLSDARQFQWNPEDEKKYNNLLTNYNLNETDWTGRRQANRGSDDFTPRYNNMLAQYGMGPIANDDWTTRQQKLKRLQRGY